MKIDKALQLQNDTTLAHAIALADVIVVRDKAFGDTELWRRPAEQVQAMGLPPLTVVFLGRSNDDFYYIAGIVDRLKRAK